MDCKVAGIASISRALPLMVAYLALELGVGVHFFKLVLGVRAVMDPFLFTHF